MRDLLLRSVTGVVVGVLACSASVLAQAPVLSSVSPAEQSVHGIITLKGSGFGAYQPGVSQVAFRPEIGAGGFLGAPALPLGARAEVLAGAPYVWRDDFIQVRVPVGRRAGAGMLPIHKGALSVIVRTASGSSKLPFQVAYEDAAPLIFAELTQIDATHDDVSGFLGSTEHNQARTKDAEIGDVDGDGWPDLLDANSNNPQNGSHEVLRINQGNGLGFVSSDWEPLVAGENGTFSVTINPGGDYVGDGLSYDSDFADLNNDLLVDWIHAVGHNGRLRIAINNHLGTPGKFLESTSTWVTQQPPDKNLDDVAHADLNQDGFVDVGTAARQSPRGYVYLNNNGQAFHPPLALQWSGSIHDIFFLDATNDGFHDVVLVAELQSAQLFVNDGNPMPAFQSSVVFNTGAFVGESADFNGDGLPDVALLGHNTGAVHLNPGPGGNWQTVNLPNPIALSYDVEMGDIDLDGDVDLVGAAVNGDGSLACVIWLNDGDGTFTNLTQGAAENVLPGIGDYERLSADLIDFDLDGDLDLYITGADGQNVYGFGFGRAPNQFFENLVRD